MNSNTRKHPSSPHADLSLASGFMHYITSLICMNTHCIRWKGSWACCSMKEVRWSLFFLKLGPVPHSGLNILSYQWFSKDGVIQGEILIFTKLTQLTKKRLCLIIVIPWTNTSLCFTISFLILIVIHNPHLFLSLSNQFSYFSCMHYPSTHLPIILAACYSVSAI